MSGLRQWFFSCRLIVNCCSNCLWVSVYGPCLAMQYLVSFLVLQSSHGMRERERKRERERERERERWLLLFNCVLALVCLLVFSSKRVQRRIQDFWKGSSKGVRFAIFSHFS